MGSHRRFLSSSSSSSNNLYGESTSVAEERAKAREQHLSETPLDISRSVDKSNSVHHKVRVSQVTIAEVLKRKHMLRWVDPVLPVDSTAQQAVVVCIERGLSGMMVVDYAKSKGATMKRGNVVGMITSRDLLRILAAGIKDQHLTMEQVLAQPISKYMTPISHVIYARPDETIGMCRSIMAKLGVKCLPILNNGRVEGLITSRDLSEYGLEVTDRGGKSNFLKDVSERVGLSSAGTSMAEPPAYLASHLVYSQQPLFLNVGVAALPHPFKGSYGTGNTKKEAMYLQQIDQEEQYSSDPAYSEDAHFVVEMLSPADNEETTNHDGNASDASNYVSFTSDAPNLKDIVYMGIADGVGSWREYGVDPRLFSRALMEECRSIVLSTVPHSMNGAAANLKNHRYPTPAEVLAEAHERVKARNVIGSSTACVAMFDGSRHQLHFSNLGDSGIIVLRHIDSDVAGALKRDRMVRREERQSDLRVAFVSQQQLKSFNHPYQLGWTGEELKADESKSFKTAAESCTTSIHIRRGDIIIMASDGLFDNVDIDDIARVALDWERKNDFINYSGDLNARENRWLKGNSLSSLSSKVIPDLALTLCKIAREKSLDDYIDSPFAILAKENDIMWSGGMPDDCTIIAMHVVGQPGGDGDGSNHT